MRERIHSLTDAGCGAHSGSSRFSARGDAAESALRRQGRSPRSRVVDEA